MKPKIVVDTSKDIPRTKQSFKRQQDINVIMGKFVKTGVLDPQVVTRRKAVFGTFTGFSDYHQLQNTLADCNQAFEELPTDIKIRFKQDPGKLIDFLANPENQLEAEKLGLVPRTENPPTEAKPNPVVEKPTTEEPKAQEGQDSDGVTAHN